jgi:hypothetical protein
VDLGNLNMNYDPAWRDFGSLRKALRVHDAFSAKAFPERPTQEAWEACFSNYSASGRKSVVFAASLRPSSSSEARSPLKAELKTVTLDRSHRLARKFGADRFLEVSIPSLQQGSVKIRNKEAMVPAITHWIVHEAHFLLGRQWRAFFVRGIGQRDNYFDPIRFEPESRTTYVDRFFFFAEGVHDIRSTPIIGNKKPSTVNSSNSAGATIPIERMLDWLLQVKRQGQQKQPYLKLFSRIALALSRTIPILVLEKEQIINKSRDVGSSTTSAIMNDGCGLMSRALATRVQLELGLPYIPPAVQGRLGPAKGMWALDVTDRTSEIWITTYPSQRKWDCDWSDPEQRTFEIREHSSPLRSAALNLQFIHVLEDRAVDKAEMRHTLAESLKTDLLDKIDSLKNAMQSPVPQSFRKWIADNSPTIAHRLHHGRIEFLGGMPKEKSDGIAMLSDAGFEASKLKYIQDVAFDMQRQKCESLKKRMKIKIAQSAYIYMIPDFWGLLEEDEVHLGFSNQFSSECTEVMLHDIDVLVARAPAHFSSDIQRVKAVFKPQLRELKDVIVFPIKGAVSLASKLSGGDYDGDRAWVCWDQDIVTNFVNARVPDPDQYADLWKYVCKDQTPFSKLNPPNPIGDMVARGLTFNLQRKMLGTCTVYKEKLCYKNNSISDRSSILLSQLVSELVDQSKQGVRFSENDWIRFRKGLKLPMNPKEPAYRGEAWDATKEATHILDYLKFCIAKPEIEAELSRLNTSLKSNVTLKERDGEESSTAHFYDADLVQPYEWFKAVIQKDGSQPLNNIMLRLEQDVLKIRKEWDSHHGSKGIDFVAQMMDTYEKYIAIRVEDYPRLGDKMDGKAIALLSQGWISDPELSSFGLIKASLAFKLWYKESPKLPFYMAGRILAEIKSKVLSKANGPVSFAMAGEMYAGTKPDSGFIRQLEALRAGNRTEYLEELAEERANDFDAEELNDLGFWDDDENY